VLGWEWEATSDISSLSVVNAWTATCIQVHRFCPTIRQVLNRIGERWGVEFDPCDFDCQISLHCFTCQWEVSFSWAEINKKGGCIETNFLNLSKYIAILRGCGEQLSCDIKLRTSLTPSWVERKYHSAQLPASLWRSRWRTGKCRYTSTCHVVRYS